MAVELSERGGACPTGDYSTCYETAAIYDVPDPNAIHSPQKRLQQNKDPFREKAGL
jgi:hypothetical protein